MLSQLRGTCSSTSHRVPPIRASRVGLGVTIALASLSAVGCFSEDPATVYVTNSRAAFVRTVGLEQSWSWEPARLGPVADDRIQSTTRVGLASYTPREVFVFDSHYAFPTVPGDGLPGIKFATQPGAARPLSGPTPAKAPTVSRLVDFGVRLAQLVDRGRCTTQLPWKALQSQVLIGATKRPGFLLQTKTTLDANSWSLPEWNGQSQPFFSVDPADSFPDTPAFNGLSFRMRWRQNRDCGIFGICNVVVRARGDYAVRVADGLPKFEAAAWGVDIDKDGSTKAAEIGLGFLSTITPAGLFFPGFVSGDPEKTIERMMSTNLANAMTYGFKVGSSSPGLNPNLFGITCDPYDKPAGDAVCGSQQAIPPAVASVRDFFIAATTRRIADRLKISLPAAEAMAKDIVPKLDRRGFWCDERPQADLEQLPTDARPDQMGMCRWHPVYKRVNVLPDRLELVSTEFDEPETTPEIEMIRWWVSGPQSLLGVPFDPRPTCSTHVFDPLPTEGPEPVPRFVHTL